MRGKFTERNDGVQTKVNSEPEKLWIILATPYIEVMNHAFVRDYAVLITWKQAAEEHAPNLQLTNEDM